MKLNREALIGFKSFKHPFLGEEEQQSHLAQFLRRNPNDWLQTSIVCGGEDLLASLSLGKGEVNGGREALSTKVGRPLKI